ncbi:MAG: response regulator [Nitrososphaeraceae archaeon]|nr:response regulator [Nitrososphaeraceae archaeon]
MSTKGKNILIVDDDEDLNNLFKTFLEINGYKVDTFTDPVDALYYFRKNLYDLAFLDLEMPKMGGMKLSKKLKNIDPTLFLIFITDANEEYIEHLKRDNPEVEKIIIYKPIWLNELRSIVHSLLSKHQQPHDKKQLLMIL